MFLGSCTESLIQVLKSFKSLSKAKILLKSLPYPEDFCRTSIEKLSFFLEKKGPKMSFIVLRLFKGPSVE